MDNHQGQLSGKFQLIGNRRNQLPGQFQLIDSLQNQLRTQQSIKTGVVQDSYIQSLVDYESRQSGLVLTYFDRVGTVGMERDYSWSFIPSQAVCVHFEFQATDWNRKYNPSDLCGGSAQLDPKTGVPSRGQRVLLTQRMTLHANISQGKPQSRRC